MKEMHLLIKPASGNCNMRCKYCFYEDEMNNRSVQSYGMMSEETLHNLLTQVFTTVQNKLTIAFQGGEPTLIGLDFYKNLVSLVNTLNIHNLEIHYAIQTNGYIINEDWMQFFQKNKFLVGISLDGNQEIHDKYRIDAHGNGTYERVMASIELLKKYKVDFNILTVVHKDTTEKANIIYNFFKRNNFGFQQYIECLDPIGEEPGSQEYSLTPDIYGDFLIKLFKKYYRDMSQGTYVYNRYFENIIGILMRQPPESCAMAGRCGSYLTVEADGSVYPCDFYVLDKWKLGNFNTDTIEQMITKRNELEFIELSNHIPDECKSCRWFPLCRNGCRRNCEPVSIEERKVNYFCESYKKFYEYAYPYLEQLCDQYSKH